MVGKAVTYLRLSRGDKGHVESDSTDSHQSAPPPFLIRLRQDVTVRNAVIGFPQFRKTHLMENLLYNELVNRGYNVDVRVVEKYTPNQIGNYSKKDSEVDFVANKGSEKFYIPFHRSIRSLGGLPYILLCHIVPHIKDSLGPC